MGGYHYIGKKTEEDTNTDKHTEDGEIFLPVSVHPEENEDTYTRTREEARHHRAGGYEAIGEKLREYDRRRAVGYKSEYRGDNVADKGLIVHNRAEVVHSNKEDERIDKNSDEKDEKR